MSAIPPERAVIPCCLLATFVLQACSPLLAADTSGTPDCVPKADVSLSGYLDASFQPLTPMTYPVSGAYAIVFESSDQQIRITLFVPGDTPPGTYSIEDAFTASPPRFSARLGLFGDPLGYLEVTGGSLTIDRVRPCLAGSFAFAARDLPETGPIVDVEGAFDGITNGY